MEMRVLLTGGAGYLGCHAAAELRRRGHSVRIFDRLCFGNPLPEFELLQGDIRRLQEHPTLLDGVDAVLHLASLSNDPSCDLDADMAADVNVESTIELAKLAAQRGIARFVFGSSCSVYGRGVFELLDEASPANPVSTFGKTKRAAEEGLLKLRSETFAPVIARTATMFGWSPRMRFDLAINQMVATALRQGRIVVRGGGNQWRPFVHVRDVAEALAALLEAPAERVAGEIFNVGRDDYNLRIRELAERVAQELGGAVVEIAKDDDDLRDFRVRFFKLPETLGVRCMRTVEEGIAELRAGLTEDPRLDPFDEQHTNVKRMKRLLATPVGEGGEPVAARFIPLARPNIGPEEEAAVVDALRSGWLTSGPKIGAFETAFAKTAGARHAVAVVSCTAALHLCLVDAGVGPGDEVITSPITWASTGNTILNMGAKAVFADIEARTLNMDPARLEALVTERTRAIMPVHMAGHPCDLDAIRAIADKHGIPLIEDAAHALGATYRDTPIGGCSPYTCFSFYAIKNVTTMEGGSITVADAERAERLRLLAVNGMSANAWERYGRSAVPKPVEVITPGYKYLMGNVSAAMGVEQLKKFPSFLAARKRIAAMYQAVLGDVEEIELPGEADYAGHAWHLFIIRFRLERLTRNRDELVYDLRRENVGTGIHFYGLHLHQYYREALGMRPEDLPEATRASHEIVSLPLHPGMSDKNVHEVVAALKKVIVNARRR